MGGAKSEVGHPKISPPRNLCTPPVLHVLVAMVRPNIVIAHNATAWDDYSTSFMCREALVAMATLCSILIEPEPEIEPQKE
jgi:hypothetical protein